MEGKRIRQLVELMPSGVRDVNRLPHLWVPPPTPVSRAERFAHELNQPDFGFRLINSFIQAGLALPLAVHEAILRRAYRHFARSETRPDSLMTSVEVLTTAHQEYHRHLLHALLLCRDASLAQIAEWLSLDEQVVRIYEQIHFNVRDRMADRAYLARLVFPEGRVAMLKPDYSEEVALDVRLLQAGYLHGANEVLFLSGLSSESASPDSLQHESKDFEAALMQNAGQLARAGFLNAKSAPGIDRAKIVLAAAKRTAPPEKTFGDDVVGIGGMTMGRSILDTINGLEIPFLERRTQMITEAAEQDQSAAKRKEKAPSSPG